MKKFSLLKYLKYLFKRKIYYAFVRSWPIWYFVINREGRKLWKESQVGSSELEKRIAKELSEKGISLTDVHEFFGEDGQSIFEKLKGHMDFLKNQDRSESEIKEVKPHFIYLLGTKVMLDIFSPPVSLAIHQRILNTVGNYFGVSPKFHTLELNVTKITSEGTKPFASQRWHRDPEDRRICKVFLYLNDVGEGAGPFSYVLGSQEGGRWRKFYPQSPPAGRYPPDGEVEKKIPKEEIKVAMGRAGTLIFCDTSGLHKGGYATKSERLIYIAGFTSRACDSPPKFIYPDAFEKNKAVLSPLQKYALTNWHK